MSKTGNILLCGVGGQGILLASEIASSVLIKAGFDVKKSEVHGMAQRGGSVVAHLRYGKKVYSPLIEFGSADIAVSFELLESLRYLPYYRKETKVVVNTQKILPAPVSTGVDTYPADVLEQLKSRGLEVFPIDAFNIAKSVGETRAVNMVLVGAMSVFLSVDEKIFLEVVDERVPEKVRQVNRQAFLKGREIIEAMRPAIKGGKVQP
ncbi:Related to indolepyruvate ferredoxin oxidoreductase, beta subunit [Candidatus Sulfobium mesophilum]|uniref:Related to indolepyruvate ferredoxin oxidoreductase, beta subunit n=1 Tax=Candidatus Sulfobium mesophilum TaxID=2016548 RepID=A0A2U3QJ37_9BACT|nr:Related to indolepyruvate ferredoxin oxidoreductase, beta subunit [Candidatus Sulfobium mesophilum]